MNRVATLALAVAAVVGMPAAKRQRLMDEDTAEVVIRRAFDPSAARGFGLMRPERSRAIAADIVMRQQDGLATLLLKCALFRAAAKGKHQVVISVSYERDSTCHSISQALIQKVGRATTRRLATEVLNHSCVISAALMSPDELPTYVEETFILPSLILKGATAEFIAAAMQRGVPLAQPRFFEALTQAADQLVVNVRSDIGSNNKRAIKHFAEVIGVDAQSSCFDTTACELHACNRIKAQVDDIVENVGKLYSIGKLFGSPARTSRSSPPLSASVLARYAATSARAPQPPGQSPGACSTSCSACRPPLTVGRMGRRASCSKMCRSSWGWSTIG